MMSVNTYPRAMPYQALFRQPKEPWTQRSTIKKFKLLAFIHVKKKEEEEKEQFARLDLVKKTYTKTGNIR